MMKKKLDEGLYNDPWDFVDDMWLMFNNAWLYNRKTSKVYKFCTKVGDTSLDSCEYNLPAHLLFIEQLRLHKDSRLSFI